MSVSDVFIEENCPMTLAFRVHRTNTMALFAINTMAATKQKTEQ